MSSSGTADAGITALLLNQPPVPARPRAARSILALPLVVALIVRGLLTDVVFEPVLALLTLTLCDVQRLEK